MKPIFLLVLSLAGSLSFSQENPITLPAPTGAYAVGTITYEWSDVSRQFNYSSHNGDPRTLVVQLWYPTDNDSLAKRAAYSALSPDYRQVSTHSRLRPSMSKAVASAPLIMIAPGRGTERFLYTSLAEELASHGYVVASVDMPGIGYTIYGDGLIVKPSKEYKTPPGMMAGPYEKVDEFFEKPTAMGRADLEYAFSKIQELNENDPSGRFNGRISEKNLGIFSHSLGGRIAGAFTAANPSVKAYMSMEGVPPRNVRYEGIIQIPIAMLCSSGTLPYAIENYNSLTDNRSNTVYMVELKKFGHNSVTDNPFIYPDSFGYEIEPGRGLEVTRILALAYFNEQLRNESSFKRSAENIEEIELVVHAKRN